MMHIVPVDYGIDYNEKRRLMYDPDNLCALCHDCHVMTKDGLNASTVIMYEFNRARDNSLLTVLTASMGVRENPLTVIIVFDDPFYAMLQGDKTDLLGGFEDDSLFAHTEDATL